MVSKDQKKLNRVINFVKKGLSGLADELESTVKAINDFTKSLQKAQKDLKDVSVDELVQTVSTSSKKVAGAGAGVAKAAAANTLFSLLGSGGGKSAPKSNALTPAPTAPGAPAAARAPPKAPGPPTRPGGAPAPPKAGGPPKRPGGGPSSAGPPKAPGGGGPPKRPSAPKLPPSAGSGPPKAPGGAPPSAHARRPGPPGGAPVAAPSAAPSAAPQAGGGLSSLRDEMLDELTRLKKIMRGES